MSSSSVEYRTLSYVGHTALVASYWRPRSRTLGSLLLKRRRLVSPLSLYEAEVISTRLWKVSMDSISRRAPLSPLIGHCQLCLLYTSDAADEEDSVDLGGRRIIKKK